MNKKINSNYFEELYNKFNYIQNYYLGFLKRLWHYFK